MTGENSEAQGGGSAKDTPLANEAGTHTTSSEGPPHCLPSVSSHLVDLSDNGIHHFPFEGPENNGLVLNWIKHKASAWLDHTSTNIVDGGDSNYKAIPASMTTRKALCVKEPLDRLQQESVRLGVGGRHKQEVNGTPAPRKLNGRKRRQDTDQRVTPNTALIISQ